MKKILLILPLFVSAFSFGQNTHILTGGMNAQIINDGQQVYVHANPNINTIDTFYILSTGQSNMGFVANAISASDTVSNPKVQIFDRGGTATWVTAIPGVSPFPVISGANIGCNIAWYTAKYIQAATGKYVRIVNYYHASTAISGWFNGASKGPDMDSVVNSATAAGIPRVDLFIWDQGENNDATAPATYNLSWDSVKQYLRRQTFFNPSTPIAVVGMPQVAWGSSTAFIYSDRTLRGFQGNQDPWDFYVTTDSAVVNTSDIHFTNAGKKTIAANIVKAYNRIPFIVPSKMINAGYVTLTSYDSVASPNSYQQQVNLQNTSSSGTSGVLMSSEAGTAQFRLLSQNGSVAYSGVFAAGENVISSENSKSLGIYTAFTKRALISSSGIDVTGAVTQTQTGTNLFNGYKTTGENSAHTWIFGGVGSTYSNSPTQVDTWTLYNLSTGPQLNVSSGGLLRVGHGVQNGQARITLDPAVSANNNGVLGMVMSVPIGVVTDNNTVSGTITHTAINALAADTLYFGAGTATTTNASTLYIAGAPVAQTSHTTITNPFALYINSGTSQFNGDVVLGTAGNALKITEGSNGRVGQTTLISGTKAITISGLTASSRAFVSVVSQGGTSTTVYEYTGVCTSNTLTITAITTAGATVTTDTSVINYFVIN